MEAVIAGLTAGHVVVDIGHSLREGFYMLWDTLWALVAGFALSGAVQAFVSRQHMRSSLGDHGARAIGRASIFGSLSSSCSYAASAMAKSLFAGGADFVTSMVFMFASTNLVVELGIVLWVLLGWQFVAAEAVGGVIMIVALVLVGPRFFAGPALVEAKRHARTQEHENHHHHENDIQGEPTPPRWKSLAGWSDVAGYTMSDLTMLRKELVIGFGLAGFLTELIPVHLWNDLFLHGHGFWTTLENVIVGPLVAILSFVCSIGNVPLAAALWNGGISFGGVTSFIFADLITLPLLFIYAKQYGRQMTLRMLGVFWSVMSLSGLATQALFHLLDWEPISRRTQVVSDSLQWNYTTYLDLVALVGLGGIYWLYRRSERLGAGHGLAKDPVCGMQVEQASAPATAEVAAKRFWFCSQRCRDRFLAQPERRETSLAVSRATVGCGSPPG